MSTKTPYYNRLLFGLSIGLLIPFIAFLLFYIFRYSDLSLGKFIGVYFNLGILTHIVSLSVLPNLLVFFGFIRKNWLYSARGTLLATILFAIVVAIVRFI